MVGYLFEANATSWKVWVRVPMRLLKFFNLPSHSSHTRTYRFPLPVTAMTLCVNSFVRSNKSNFISIKNFGDVLGPEVLIAVINRSSVFWDKMSCSVFESQPPFRRKMPPPFSGSKKKGSLTYVGSETTVFWDMTMCGYSKKYLIWLILRPEI